MSTPRTAHRDPEHVARLLSAALTATPDDLDHPAHDQLTALVEGRLDEADRDWVEAHMEYCAVCREDVADLAEIRAALSHGHLATTPGRPTWLKPAIGFGAVAAVLALAFWIGGRTPDAPAPPVVASNNPASPVSPESTVAVNVLTAMEQEQVATALASGRIEFPPDVSLLRSRAGTLLGSSRAAAPLTPLTPTRTSIVTARPEFSWTAVAGATGYEVAVFDDQFKRVAHSGPIAGLTWQPGSDVPRGRVLAWQVTAHTPQGDVVSPAPPQPEARFRVLSSTDAAAMDAERVRLAAEPIALGLALAQAGLFDEARTVMTRALTDARYDTSQVRALIDQIK